MIYSFNTDYTSLSGTTVPYDIYNNNFEKIISVSTPVSANSILTGNLGGIYVVPNFLSAGNNISDTNFYVDFGDGTIVENNLSAFHKYKVPGNYPITLVVTNSAGFLFKASTNYVLNVKDPIPDKIFITQDDKLQYASESTVQFYITRFNSLNTSKILSANDYSIKLSVDGNASTLQLQDEYIDNKNFQYENKSFFFTSPDDKFEVIESVKTNNTFIYGKKFNGELVLSTLSAEDNQLVGTSGFGTFRYFEPIF
jgi:PKD repeat protein